MVATFNGNPRATIISCYSPTNVSEETELVTFYDVLSSLVRSIPKHNMLVIGGDINAQTGKNGNTKYSLHNTSNRNGQHSINNGEEITIKYTNNRMQKKPNDFGQKYGNQKNVRKRMNGSAIWQEN